MFHFYSRVICLLGFVLGVFLGIIYIRYTQSLIRHAEIPAPSYETWFNNKGIQRQNILWDSLRYSNKSYLLEARYLFSTIKVLCVIFTRNEKNIRGVNDTWARGCNGLKIVALNEKKKILPLKRSKEDSSWVSLCRGLLEIDEKLDWILIVNDNTFVIMENLRYYLAPLEANKNYYLGHAVKFWSTVYNSGQAGYVISRGTLNAFKKTISKNECSVGSYWNREDFYLGKHLANLNITPIDTRDAKGLSTFHPYNWYHVFFPGESYYKTSFYPTKCCSKKSVTFQAVDGDKMYLYYYLLYTLQIFYYGNVGNRPPLMHESDDKVWKTFLRERDIRDDYISSDEYYKLWENLIDDPKSFASKMKKEHHFDYD